MNWLTVLDWSAGSDDGAVRVFIFLEDRTEQNKTERQNNQKDLKPVPARLIFGFRFLFI